VATATRSYFGLEVIQRQNERIDGLSVILLFVFAVALMGNVLETTIADPLLVLGIVGLSFAVSVAVWAITTAVFIRAGLLQALTLGHSAGNRNMGLMLAAAAGAVPEVTWLYVALAQLPIYLLPHLLKPLVHRLGERHPE
jgi:BASS family bile acid:Na+ symporter